MWPAGWRGFFIVSRLHQEIRFCDHYALISHFSEKSADGGGRLRKMDMVWACPILKSRPLYVFYKNITLNSVNDHDTTYAVILAKSIFSQSHNVGICCV